MNYKWVMKMLNPFARSEYEKKGISLLLGTILYNRGYSAENYETINNNFFKMADTYCDSIPCLHAVANRINRALLEKDTEVLVFSDYDTDGITSAAIFNDFASTLAKADNRYHNNFDITIPERKDGYGLNLDWCTTLIAKKEKDKNYLVVTFDNGITKNKLVEYLKRNNIEVVITDHHEPDKEIPSGIVVDPKKDEERFGAELCGAGISWLIAYQMYRKYCSENPSNKEVQKQLGLSLQRCLDFAAVGTVGDMMNMSLFNLSMIKNGLNHINSKNNTNTSPLYSLIDCFNLKEVTSKDIGFNIAAAINACGQMGQANTAMDLFLDEKTQEENAQTVCSLLNKSRDETKRAKQDINSHLYEILAEDSLIDIITLTDIPHGIAGKLANYLCDNTGRPTIILIDDGGKELTGSGRCTNPTIDLLALLKPLEKAEVIKSAAGHKAACGVCFYRDKIEEAKSIMEEKLLELADKLEVDLNPVQTINIDAIISVKDISLKTYLELCSMPYSMDFNPPNLLLKGRIVKAKASRSNPNNICYTVKDLIGTETIDIWVWNKKVEEYKKYTGDKISIVGNIVRNFMSPNKITLDVLDLKFE